MTCLGIVKMVEHVFTTPSNVLAHRDFMDKTAPKGFNLFDVLNIWIFGPTSPIINDIDVPLNIYSYHVLQVLYWVCKSEGATTHRLQVSSLYFPPPASSRRYLLIIISITIVIRRIVSLGGPNGSQPVYKVNNKHFQSSQNTQKAILHEIYVLSMLLVNQIYSIISIFNINYWLSEVQN